MSDLVERLLDERSTEEILMGLAVMATALEAKGHPNGALYMRVAATELTRLRAQVAALEAEIARLREAGELLDWLGTKTNLELSYHGWDDYEDWQVHQVNGGRNDRVWTKIADQATPLEAIRAARTELQEQETHDAR